MEINVINKLYMKAYRSTSPLVKEAYQEAATMFDET